MKTQGIAEWTHREMETLIHSLTRYTRFVRSTKAVLGVLAIFLTGMLLFYPLLHSDNAGIRVAFTSIEKGAASPTKMINAHLHGLDKDDQPYNVNASTATQEDEDTIGLDKVTADISLKSGVWLSMSANNGVFKMKEKLLELKGSVDMFDDEGYEFRTEVLHVDVGQRTAVTHEPVQGQGPLGTLRAHGAMMDGKSQVTTFEGPVLVTIYPYHGDDKAKQKEAQ